MNHSILTVSGLDIELKRSGCFVPLVRNTSFFVGSSESVCLVGESGSGKTVTALAIMGLLPLSFRIKSGSILFDGIELARLDQNKLNRIRGRRLSMVFQEPMTALNPVFTIGSQIKEGIAAHERLTSKELNRRTLDILERVGMPDPQTAFNAYPHELSGGLRQRAMIAMALSCHPDMLIADEPTTALDVSLQAHILGLLSELRRGSGLALLFITHNLGVVAQVAERVIIVYAGKIVEEAGVFDLFDSPLHPYTKGLLESIPYFKDGSGGVDRERRLKSIPGNIPPLEAIPHGCPFQDRCGEVMDVCRRIEPTEVSTGRAHKVACHLYG
ncbi:MAG: ABC transporter ATP-binding protein [Dissulfurimicrobium sp.]|uniref:ABC transporter ATP-binding protein n=1 Tax=Dissulfurimicrobium TaxID=1769732 RepID=UPI001EDA93EC|nr:ABC transporter ATP-binding protein [Dissulfurimicrobium hydrothermale]UKL14062.1 ABC transporter ATP-binding protein [Dissulfurimicrobium hydrothermale]